jgi:transcription termination factor NusB
MTRDQKNKAKQRLEVLELRLDGINALTENMSDKGGAEIASILEETAAEIASILEETAADVIAAIAKNKAALTAAISKRLKNDEDTSAYEAVESLIIKTAIEAGVPKKYAEDVPWMETYAVPGESTVKSDLEGLEGELIDMIDNPNPEVTFY